ncbi:hypothetical protein PR048_027487 [Dryococelus australis]|uniref:WIF domain-containing protein n=1 Tax=Dryococelus australis TaxID=614101 RepID=A0ABQ9GGF8_9NEOP|nr:hypothetical protein PR048_027487 [Dryococelus australis]
MALRYSDSRVLDMELCVDKVICIQKDFDSQPVYTPRLHAWQAEQSIRDYFTLSWSPAKVQLPGYSSASSKLSLAKSRKIHQRTTRGILLTECPEEATVAERLACSSPTMAIQVQSPAGSLRIFARVIVPDDTVADLPLPPSFHSGTASYSPPSASSALKTSLLRAAQSLSLVTRVSGNVQEYQKQTYEGTVKRRKYWRFAYPSACTWAVGTAQPAATNTFKSQFPTNQLHYHLTLAGFSHVRTLPDHAAGRRVFSEISRFPGPCTPSSLHLKPRSRSHYRAHRLSFWLNLVPELHCPGDDVPLSHHVLDHLGRARTRLTQGRGRSPAIPATSAGPAPTTGMPLPPPPPASDDDGGLARYSTALGLTVAVGCALLTLNVLVFAGACYRSRPRRSPGDGGTDPAAPTENGRLPNSISADLFKTDEKLSDAEYAGHRLLEFTAVSFKPPAGPPTDQ